MSYCGHLFKAVTENEYCNILSLTTFSCEKFFANLRYDAHYDNTSMQAEETVMTSNLKHLLKEDLNVYHSSMSRSGVHAVDIESSILWTTEEIVEMFDLAKRTVHFVTRDLCNA